MENQIILPNFLIIGAARSGTTTLYTWLQEHPNIYLPLSKRPEPHFFLKSVEYEKGINYYSKHYFNDWSGEKAIGEKSTSYLYQAEIVAPRIKNHLPNAKLIVLLRNPVDRAYSSYWFTVASGLETLSFQEALIKEKERVANPGSKFWKEVQPHAYVDRGHYLTQLQIYMQYFKRDQLYVGLFDDLINHPDDLVREIFNFLRVDNSFRPDSLFQITNIASRDRQPMDTEIRCFLTDLYRDEIHQLAIFLDRDLSHWESSQ